MLRTIFSELGSSYIVLRNKDMLPQRSGFDIDLLIDSDNLEQITQLCLTISKRHGVITVCKTNRIVFFDLNYSKDKRNWAIFDLQTEYTFGDRCMYLADLLFLPEAQRDVLIKNVQDARKGRASHEIQEMLGIKPYAVPASPSLSFLQRTKRKILARAFFIHMHVMPLIVISGPDGVGKTTLLRNILLLLDMLPLNTKSFHHTGLSKENALRVECNEQNMSLVRRLRRRFIPSFIKKIYGAIAGEIQYAQRINQEIVKNFYSGTLTFSDRYIYDRTIKMRMLSGKMPISKLVTHLNAYLMRRPTILIIPTDEPDAIFKRKQELQPNEIVAYYDELRAITQNCSVSCVHYVYVAGKTPEALAIEATEKILCSLSPAIFNFIGVYEKKLKRG